MLSANTVAQNPDDSARPPLSPSQSGGTTGTIFGGVLWAIASPLHKSSALANAAARETWLDSDFLHPLITAETPVSGKAILIVSAMASSPLMLTVLSVRRTASG